MTRWLAVLLLSCSTADYPADLVESAIPRYGHLGDDCQSGLQCLWLSEDLSDMPDAWSLSAQCARVSVGDAEPWMACGFVCSMPREFGVCQTLGGECLGRDGRFWCLKR